MAWMSDEEFVYRQDIKEKKATGRGAFHKKGGSKSKKCNFPSDYMTRKEKQALNGEVMSYNPNKFYSYAEFKQLPMEYQIKYINSLLLRYNCGLKAISEVVFHCNGSSLYAYFKRKGQQQYLNSAGTKGGHAMDAGRKRLEVDVAAARTPKPAEEIQNESVEEAPKELTVQEKIDQAAETVKLYESRGMAMTPELINQIYEEKTGMSFALAMEHTGEPIGKVEKVEGSNEAFDEDSKKPEDSTDVEAFSITMHELDQDVINYIRDLFGAKDILVKIEVHQIK